MDTTSLRLFVKAAERLNISSAGRELGMSPATASTRLAKLEGELGADLLRRSTRKVALSLEGEEFLPYAREILAQESAALAALGRGNVRATGTLRFAAPSTFAQRYIMPILPLFLEAQPELKLDLRLTDLQSDLILGSFDLALRNAALDDSGLKGRKLAEDRRILCASPAYLKRHPVPECPADLSQHHLLGFQSDLPVRLIDGAGTQAEFHPRESHGRLIVDDGANLKAATLAGAGISLNSLWNVDRDLASGALIRVLPAFSVMDYVALWLVYPKSNVLTAKVRVFIDFLIDKVRPQIPSL